VEENLEQHLLKSILSRVGKSGTLSKAKSQKMREDPVQNHLKILIRYYISMKLRLLKIGYWRRCILRSVGSIEFLIDERV
jgi:hypothetical protein